jgi:hypothetical protein
MQLQLNGKAAFAYTAAHDIAPAKRSVVFVHGAGLDHSWWGLQSRYFGYHGFNVLAVDAFSSDSIPVHLLTVEAFRLYFHQLKPNGVLAVHVSNKYLDLKPIVELAARALDKETRVIDTDDEDEIGEFGSTWILVADHAFFLRPEIKDTGSKLMASTGLRMWTDDYSNLFRILK